MVDVKIDMTGWIMSEHGVPDSRLIVIGQTEDYVKPSGKRESRWICECNCDKHTIFAAVGHHIRKGLTKSCGCLKVEKTKESCKKYNVYKLDQEYGIGIASNCDEEFYFDLEDYDKIKQYCWCKDPIGYMKTRTPENKWIHMHRLITNNQYELVDHINHNQLDNRKSNLRDASRQINTLNRPDVISTNTSGFTGVYFHTSNKKWVANLSTNNKTYYLGSFADKNDAIKARLEAEKKYFGEFAPQRHLFEEYGIEDIVEEDEINGNN